MPHPAPARHKPRDFEDFAWDHLKWTRGSRARFGLDLPAAGSQRDSAAHPGLSVPRTERAEPRARPRARIRTLVAPPLPVPRPLTIVTGAVGPRPAPARSERVPRETLGDSAVGSGGAGLAGVGRAQNTPDRPSDRSADLHCVPARRTPRD